MTLKRELIQRAADLLKRFHPETPIVALTDPEHGDVDDLGITAGELCGAMEAFTRPAFIIEANPPSADDIATLLDAGKKMGGEVRGHIFPAPTMIRWLLEEERGLPVADASPAVAWRWKFDQEGIWHYGDTRPAPFRFGDPVVIEPLFITTANASERAEALRTALQRISELTPASANARDARDMHLTVKAIADVALEAERNGSAISSSGEQP